MTQPRLELPGASVESRLFCFCMAGKDIKSIRFVEKSLEETLMLDKQFNKYALGANVFRVPFECSAKSLTANTPLDPIACHGAVSAEIEKPPQEMNDPFTLSDYSLCKT